MRHLGYQQAIWIYRRVVEETGGSPGLRDEGLLRSALARPQASFGGQDLYPTLFEKAAALAESLVRNHPFVDGNKRMALACLHTFLRMNGFRLACSQEARAELILSVAEKRRTAQDTAEWLVKRTERFHP